MSGSDETPLAEKVLEGIGRLFGAAVAGYEEPAERFMAIGNHVAHVIGENTRLKKRTAELERRISNAGHALAGAHVVAAEPRERCPGSSRDDIDDHGFEPAVYGGHCGICGYGYGHK